MIEGLPVDEDVGGMRFGPEVGGDFALHGHASGFHPVACLAAGAVSEVGEELVEAAHGRADDTHRSVFGAVKGEIFGGCRRRPWFRVTA